MVLLIGTVLALNVTVISTIQDTSVHGTLRGLLSSSKAFLCYQKRFVVCAHRCMILVFVKESIDDFPRCKRKSTQRYSRASLGMGSK